MPRGQGQNALFTREPVSNSRSARAARMAQERKEAALRVPTRIGEEGEKIWENEAGEIHREGAPAVIWSDGTQEWRSHGKLHREDGPAVTYKNNIKEWWVNDQLHRDGAPAIEDLNGNEEWYQNGVRHRIDGPALILNGTEKYYKMGKLHREDGPAVIRANGEELYFLNGSQLTKKGFEYKQANL